MKPISFFNTYIAPRGKEIVGNVLDSSFLSEGERVKEFEEQLFKNCGLLNPVAVNSGTSALHLALVAAGVGNQDEVIIPAQTFVATGMAVLMTGAKVVFADIQYETGNICPFDIEKRITAKTKAVIPVHWGGYPCDMDEIEAVAKQYGLKIIEDAAHALGATYKGKKIGTISDFTCFSFQAIKHLTTGDGGAVCCRKIDDYKKIKRKRWFGIDRDEAKLSDLGERNYDIDEIGFKYHMNDFAASLGIANLYNFNCKRIKNIANYYFEELNDIPGINLFIYRSDRESSCWLFGFHVQQRENFVIAMRDKEIPVSVVHQGIDHNTIFGGLDKTLFNQRKFDSNQIHIPIHCNLDDNQVEYIVKSIKEGW